MDSYFPSLLEITSGVPQDSILGPLFQFQASGGMNMQTMEISLILK